MQEVILNFHGLGPIPRPIDDGERDCWLEMERFEQVLDQIQRCPSARMTFDDGNASDVALALPALVRRGLKAAFFICADRLDAPGFLDRAGVRELLSAGMSVGSHGGQHRPWRGLPSADLDAELAGSRTTLEKVCGQTVDTAACPFGSYDRRVLRIARAAGYRRIYTSDGGWTSAQAWLVTRNTVRRSTPPGTIETLLAGPTRGLARLKLSLRQRWKAWR